MRKLMGLLLCTVSATASVGVEAPLAGPELKAAVSGKTVYIQSPMGEIPIRYNTNGTLLGQTELALLDGENSATDRGRWWVKDNKLCIRWQNWMEAKPYCFTMQRVSKNAVRWYRNDGKSGTARLG